ncbi:unnamed protein product [Phyllotreta striolata]|uniref:5'-nucleotidase domain-containing protein 1 n=1 Tax=Phyllotreta striolata TaxID=444603 RepID=A0A9N9TLC0_PHYSR|nr:unnamed protein product [Phyllotreta striolata]
MHFALTDYNCIGFDLDNTLARYKLANLARLQYDLLAGYLVDRKNYPREIRGAPVDTDFLLKGLAIDTKHGNVVKIARDGRIVRAAHGTKWLTEKELLEFYPQKRAEFVEKFVRNPVEFVRVYTERMKFCLDYFDSANSLIYARLIDATEHKITFNRMWEDLTEALYNTFSPNYDDKGNIYNVLKANPEEYYVRCDETVRDWLTSLKSSGITLFLVTGAYKEAALDTLEYVLGRNWRSFFDLTVLEAGKPGFFVGPADDCSNCEALSDGVYTMKCWRNVEVFLRGAVDRPKCLYVGDNLIEDVYAPVVSSSADTLHVCEELEAENSTGYHPDEKILSSDRWGSYFHDADGTPTFWNHLMHVYPKLCVPNVDYLAKFPVNHKFTSTQIV